MKEKSSTEQLFRIWNEGHYLEVGDWAEVPELIELRSVGTDNWEWFGRISVSMSADFAEQLGNALITAARAKREAGNA